MNETSDSDPQVKATRRSSDFEQVELNKEEVSDLSQRSEMFTDLHACRLELEVYMNFPSSEQRKTKLSSGSKT